MSLLYRIQNAKPVGDWVLDPAPVPEWVYRSDLRAPGTDEEPYDLTEGATAATGAWTSVLAVVLVALGLVSLVLVARKVTR